MRTVIYPVKDLAQAKTLFGKLLGVAPSWDEAYYVGFNVGDQVIGLDPQGHSQGMTGPGGYWHIDDIQARLKQLLDAGAEVQGCQRCRWGQADCVCERRRRHRHRTHPTPRKMILYTRGQFD
jgi:hypothetical protein